MSEAQAQNSRPCMTPSPRERWAGFWAAVTSCAHSGAPRALHALDMVGAPSVRRLHSLGGSQAQLKSSLRHLQRGLGQGDLVTSLRFSPSLCKEIHHRGLNELTALNPWKPIPFAVDTCGLLAPGKGRTTGQTVVKSVLSILQFPQPLSFQDIKHVLIRPFLSRKQTLSMARI